MGGGVVFSAIAPGVAHVLNLALIKVRHFVLLGMGTEAEFIDKVDHLTQVVPALQPVFQFAEDLPDLVFNGVGFLSFELLQVRKQLVIHKILQVIAFECLVKIQLTIAVLRGGPYVPSVLRAYDIAVCRAGKLCRSLAVPFQIVEVFSGLNQTSATP